MTYERRQLALLLDRLREPRRFIQVLAGPRQVGKTTLAHQARQRLPIPGHYASADGPAPRDAIWLEQQWDLGRLLARDSDQGALLVLDEVQKIRDWSEVVKARWDEDSASGVPLKVLALGSSPLLIQQGLSDSLAGRFEVLRVPHWGWPEMRDAFGWDLDRFVFFGGYPGSAPLAEDEERWAAYVRDSLVETTVSRDVLLMHRVDKPALLRQLFSLACLYTGQVLSFNKMLGQLQDAGNTTTLAHYLDLLEGASMVAGLRKCSLGEARKRGSSPKLQVYNNALATALAGVGFDNTRRTPDRWGRLVESAVGAHLLNTTQGTQIRVHYWRDRNREVDFVLQHGPALVAIEVKSGRRRGALLGMTAFDRRFTPRRKLLIGPGGIPLETFLAEPARTWIE